VSIAVSSQRRARNQLQPACGSGPADRAFERDLRVSEEIHEKRWAGRPLRQRVREQAMVLARREL
jgi:hypothetical protein